MKKSLSSICKSHNIRTMTFSEGKTLIKVLGIDDYAKHHDGFCLKLPGAEQTPTILFNDHLSEGIQNAVIAHELGHILLGHITDEYKNISKSNKVCECEYSEFIADVFSVVLMAITALKESA